MGGIWLQVAHMGLRPATYGPWISQYRGGRWTFPGITTSFWVTEFSFPGKYSCSGRWTPSPNPTLPTLHSQGLQEFPSPHLETLTSAACSGCCLPCTGPRPTSLWQWLLPVSQVWQMGKGPAPFHQSAVPCRFVWFVCREANSQSGSIDDWRSQKGGRSERRNSVTLSAQLRKSLNLQGEKLQRSCFKVCLKS